MKILTYNIASGGFDGYDNKAQEPPRLDLIKKVVNHIKPDIASLIDTFRWDKIYTNKQIANLFEYKHAYSVSLDDERLKRSGADNGITILSNIDNTAFETINLKTRNAIKTTVDTKNSTINLYSVYLDDLSENTRMQQISELLKDISNAPTIVTGDLNTFSPEDLEKTTKLAEKFLANNPRFEELRPVLNEMAKTEVIKALFERGFKDASTEHKSTYPTLLANSSNKPFVRVDYCLYKNLEIKNFDVLYEKIFDKTSDHYPILIEI